MLRCSRPLSRANPKIAFMMKKGEGDPIGIEIGQGPIHFFGKWLQNGDPETHRQKELLP